MDIGIYTFADVTPGGSHEAGLRDLVEEIHQIFRQDRIMIQMAIGAMPHKQLMRAIELLGTKVAPRVKEALQ